MLASHKKEKENTKTNKQTKNRSKIGRKAFKIRFLAAKDAL